MSTITENESSYWQYVIDPKNNLFTKLMEIIHRYPIEYPGSEFIVHPNTAVAIIDEAMALKIAVYGVQVWCYVPDISKREEYCPGGYGGPGKTENGVTSFFSEYGALGYNVPDFAKLPHTLDLAQHCNPLVKQYLIEQLPLEPGNSEYFRVSLYFHTPMWNLFPKT